jgi:hypothetical protein
LKIASTGDVIRSRDAIAKAKEEAPGSLVPLSLLNIAFSKKGLDALGIKDDLGDSVFSAGQQADAENLGDDGKVVGGKFEPDWESAFKNRIDAVLVVAGDSWTSVNSTIALALLALAGSVRVVYKLKGSVRPGAEKVSARAASHIYRTYTNFWLRRGMNTLDGKYST